MNGRYRHVVSSMDHIKTTLDEAKQEGKKVTHFITKDAKKPDQFILVEKAGGEYMSIRVQPEFYIDKIKPLMYHKTR